MERFRSLTCACLLAALLVACATRKTPPGPPQAVAAPSASAPNALAGDGAKAASSSVATSTAPVTSTAPADCGMPTSLLARGFPTELSPTNAVERTPFVPGSTTLVVLPDTQYYADCGSRHFTDQTRWIEAQAAQRNIQAALTLGDLTDKNSAREWNYIREGLRAVEDDVPVVLVTGNHDVGDRGTADRHVSQLPRYFPEAPGKARAALAATLRPGDIENAYYRVALPRVTLGVLALEWSPRSAAVTWANEILGKYPHDRVIVLTHAYLYEDGTRYDWWKKGAKQEWNPLAYGTGKRNPADTTTLQNLHVDGPHDGEMLWNDLVKRHSGIFLVVSGHVLGRGTALLESRGDSGNDVLQILANYQMLKEGGLGYLRLLEILPDGKTLRQKTYSPSLQLFAESPDQNGDLTIRPPLW